MASAVAPTGYRGGSGRSATLKPFSGEGDIDVRTISVCPRQPQIRAQRSPDESAACAKLLRVVREVRCAWTISRSGCLHLLGCSCPGPATGVLSSLRKVHLTGSFGSPDSALSGGPVCHICRVVLLKYV